MHRRMTALVMNLTIVNGKNLLTKKKILSTSGTRSCVEMIGAAEAAKILIEA